MIIVWMAIGGGCYKGYLQHRIKKLEKQNSAPKPAESKDEATNWKAFDDYVSGKIEEKEKN